MTLSIGDRLPEATFRTPGEDGPRPITSAEIFGNRKVVLFAVPGAFTPTCTMNHLPGFLDLNREIRAKGVDEIVVVSVNDVHVMKAWRNATGADHQILFLADGNADFTRAVGLDMDMAVGGMGTRSKRYSMIVDDGIVKALNVEDSPGQAETSSAATILSQL